MKKFCLFLLCAFLLLLFACHESVDPTVPTTDVTTSLLVGETLTTQREIQNTFIATTTQVTSNKTSVPTTSRSTTEDRQTANPFSAKTTKKTPTTEATTQTLSMRTYPMEINPEIEKNKEMLLSIMPLKDNQALHIANVLYMVNIGELKEASILFSDPRDYYIVLVKDVNDNSYRFIVNQRGAFGRIYKEGEKTPIYEER